MPHPISERLDRRRLLSSGQLLGRRLRFPTPTRFDTQSAAAHPPRQPPADEAAGCRKAIEVVRPEPEEPAHLVRRQRRQVDLPAVRRRSAGVGVNDRGHRVRSIGAWLEDGRKQAREFAGATALGDQRRDVLRGVRRRCGLGRHGEGAASTAEHPAGYGRQPVECGPAPAAGGGEAGSGGAECGGDGCEHAGVLPLSAPKDGG
ncbi:hypothetical protein SI859A1_01299 [Aurantimonas manganoxydans SI85-9A1]|uniref:Uncharacterized protein n=1 Tax=Aurantimonas manganoxydans (strain ATCC BAA-1229 / DSM 21871 / SI85-9A1) TaxID=287752 RepID=Q1YJ21_AURMS|nr:hypothetical protein SI859A1_01299 [Aurantimonas manganoxydans SI85-9A1]